ASILPGNYGVEKAAAGLFQDAEIAGVLRIPDHNADWAPENYFASLQPGEDARGIPAKLQKKSAYPFAVYTAADTATGQQTEILHVIARMCNARGAPTIAPCDMLPPNVNPGDTLGDKSLTLPTTPFYRVTIRVDGPQNTASFLQTMLR